MNTPLSPWVALVAVVAAAALLGTHQKRQWPASSGAAALTSLASLFAEFLVIGAIFFDCALHKPEWLEKSRALVTNLHRLHPHRLRHRRRHSLGRRSNK